MNSVINLLNQVRIVSKKTRELRRDTSRRGENFNIFNDLGLISDEVRLHSSIIAALLNPHGTHGQGSIYLSEFLKVLAKACKGRIKADFLDVDSQSLSVQVEKSIGAVTNETGGRIDLYITDTRHRIIIENKIYAGDQSNQLKRYWNYGISKAKEPTPESTFILVYLTLDGHEPSETALGGITRENYICISYKSEIIEWLNSCLAYSVNLPLIRETINQYITTINTLTHTDMQANAELLEILAHEENIDAVFDIVNSQTALCNYIINKKFIPQLKDVAEQKGFVLEGYKHSDWVNESWAGANFSHAEWRMMQGSFEFEKRGLGELIFGYTVKDGWKRADISCWEELQDRYNAIQRNNQNWIYKRFKGEGWWNHARGIKNLLNGKTLNDFADMLDELLQCAEDLDI